MAGYSIVEFEDGLQVVPTIWLIKSNTMCMWPNTKTANRITKAVTHLEPPDKKTWHTLKVLRVFGSATTYENAIFKLKLAQKISDVETGSDDDEKSQKKTRHSRAKAVVSSSSSDEEEQRGSNKSEPKNLPPLPQFLTNFSPTRQAKTTKYADVDFENPTPVNIDESTSYSSRQSTIFGEVSDNSNSQHYSSSGFHDRNTEMKGQSDTSEDPDIQRKISRKRTIEMRDKSYTLENQDIQSGTPFQRNVDGRRSSHILLDKDFPPSRSHEQTLGLGEKSSRNVKQIISMEPAPQICTQEKILRKLGKILYNIERLHDKFDRYYERGETFDPSKMAVVSEDNEEVEFPLESEHDIEIMENSWAQAACFKKAVEQFQKIGGADLHGNVINVLKRLLTDGMAVKYSWAGARNKKAFKETKLSKLLSRTVRKHFSDATEKEIEGPAGKWLAQAKVRLDRAEARKSRAHSNTTEKDCTAEEDTDDLA